MVVVVLVYVLDVSQLAYNTLHFSPAANFAYFVCGVFGVWVWWKAARVAERTEIDVFFVIANVHDVQFMQQDFWVIFVISFRFFSFLKIECDR